MGLTAVEAASLGRSALRLRVTFTPTQRTERDSPRAAEGTMPKPPALVTKSRRRNILLDRAPSTSKNDRGWKGPTIKGDLHNAKGLTATTTRGTSKRVNLEDRMALGIKDMPNIIVAILQIPNTGCNMGWEENSANTGIHLNILGDPNRDLAKARQGSQAGSRILRRSSNDTCTETSGVESNRRIHGIYKMPMEGEIVRRRRIKREEIKVFGP
jgi:hypothetical protein